ncbi:MAG: hypothetical protein KAJ73_00340 [Zetaproteobacteria bacterium]|nr:hypothetical protein [Zetaproteobacteria bacterium]
MGMPFHGSVIDGVLSYYGGQKSWPDFPLDPGNSNTLLEEGHTASSYEHEDLAAIDSENGFEWKDRFLLPHSLRPDVLYWVHIDEAKNAWWLKVETADLSGGTDGSSIEYTVTLYKRFGLFEVEGAAAPLLNVVIDSYVQSYSGGFGDGSLFNQNDPVGIRKIIHNDMYIEQNPRGDKLLIMQRVDEFNSSLTDAHWTDKEYVEDEGLTSPIRKQPTNFFSRVLAGIVELTISGTVNPETGLGLQLSGSLWKTPQDCSSLMEFYFNHTEFTDTPGWKDANGEYTCTSELVDCRPEPWGSPCCFDSTRLDRSFSHEVWYIDSDPWDHSGNGTSEIIIHAFYNEDGVAQAVSIECVDIISQDGHHYRAGGGNKHAYAESHGEWSEDDLTCVGSSSWDKIDTGWYRNESVEKSEWRTETALLINGAERYRVVSDKVKDLRWFRENDWDHGGSGGNPYPVGVCGQPEVEPWDAYNEFPVGYNVNSEKKLYEFDGGIAYGVTLDDSSYVTVDDISQPLDPYYERWEEGKYHAEDYLPRMLAARLVSNRLVGFMQMYGEAYEGQLDPPTLVGVPEYLHLITDSASMLGEVDETGAYNPYDSEIITDTLDNNPGFI